MRASLWKKLLGLADQTGLAWFKDTATDHLARMHQIKAVLEHYGHSVVMLSETGVGYVIHDDAFQVVAEPFSDTQQADWRSVSSRTSMVHVRKNKRPWIVIVEPDKRGLAPGGRHGV